MDVVVFVLLKGSPSGMFVLRRGEEAEREGGPSVEGCGGIRSLRSTMGCGGDSERWMDGRWYRLWATVCIVVEEFLFWIRSSLSSWPRTFRVVLIFAHLFFRTTAAAAAGSTISPGNQINSHGHKYSLVPFHSSASSLGCVAIWGFAIECC